MSYHRKRETALGDVASVIKNVATGVQTAVDVSSDPYLAEAICRTQQLVAIENRRPLPTCTKTPANLRGGIGLRRAMPVLRALVYAEQRPWVYPVAGAALIGVPVFLGYLLGKGLKR